MSKELEALSALRSTINLVDYQDSGQYYDKMKWLNTIEQALKRNEPMKVLEKQKVSCGLSIILNGICPKCHHQIHNNQKFCDECGKSLDWSE